MVWGRHPHVNLRKNYYLSLCGNLQIPWTTNTEYGAYPIVDNAQRTGPCLCLTARSGAVKRDFPERHRSSDEQIYTYIVDSINAPLAVLKPCIVEDRAEHARTRGNKCCHSHSERQHTSAPWSRRGRHHLCWIIHKYSLYIKETCKPASVC